MFTSDEFRIDGISYPRIPLFVDPSNMRIEHLPSEWIVHNAVVRARTSSPGTWSTYAYNLLDWINYALERGWSWRAPEERFLAHFRNELERRTPRLKPNSIAKKLQITCWFYEWAHRLGHIATLPVTYEASHYSKKAYGLQRRTRLINDIAELERQVQDLLSENFRLQRELAKYDPLLGLKSPIQLEEYRKKRGQSARRS